MREDPIQEKVYERISIVTIGEEAAEIIFWKFPLSLTVESIYLRIVRKQGTKKLNLYFNQQLLPAEEEMRLRYQEGDYLIYEDIKIILSDSSITIRARAGEYQTSLLELPPRGEVSPGFPGYKRSPRLIKPILDREIFIRSPPKKVDMKKGSLLQLILPTLLIAGVTAIGSILMEYGAFILVSLVTTIMTMIFSIVRYFNDRKEYKAKNASRKNLYETYLLKKRKELNQARNAEIDAWEYNYPSLQEIERLIHDYSDRIYERNFNDDDFLMLFIGRRRDTVSFPIKLEGHDLEMEQDELEIEAAKIKEKFTYIKCKPVVVDLKKAHLGLVGEKENIHEQLKQIIARLAFQHSYHDLQIIMIFNEKYEEDFIWMRWYPHIKIQSLNLYGMIHAEGMRDQVLGSITQIFKERKLKREENKKRVRFVPHFLFIIDEPKLIMDHGIMEYLEQEGARLGFSLIYTTPMRANLPENIGTVLLLEDSIKGKLLLNEKKLVEQSISLDRIREVDLEWMARNLSVLVHEQGVTTRIPESITFFELYGIQHPKELHIKERWRKNESHKTLAVPLGMRAVNEYVYLNLHEKAHGPHGLVAGTTGSGKSEIIQSYILSLAVNFHPYEVGFLLIDYKGGGMAGLFCNLPHLLGTITNLDGSESQRAMASIKSELARRQRIFSANNINHINAYNKLFKNGEVKEPIPHLFLISDEFAELKKEQPDFMTELVSTARIGRSLGIHLILATQKPSGVVDDQIWTNSKFKLALKVQEEADSREILKTGDAASINQPGRAYLQVGNNEIYELFQSAWSGAAYTKDDVKKETDTRTYLVNKLGQGELLNEDLSTEEGGNQAKGTQLDAVVDYLNRIFKEERYEEVKKPWLPSLPTLIPSFLVQSQYAVTADSVMDHYTDKSEGLYGPDLEFELGLVDIPESQEQKPYKISLKKDGNIVFFASAGYGKSTMLATCILSLAIRNRVRDLNFYLLDFGNNALVSLDALPHTADYITFDDSEKMGKFIRIIIDEIKQRKKLFMKRTAQNFDIYNQMAEREEERLKAIVIIVDNFDVVKELGYETEEEFTKISRDGSGLGIYMIISALQESGVRYATLNNFKVKIAGYLFDETDAPGIMGRSEYKLPEIQGRAYVKDKNVNVMQIYTMVDFQNEIEYNVNLKKLINEIGKANTSERAPRIPVLPDKFVYSMFRNYKTSGGDHHIYFGLDVEHVILTGIDRMNTPFVILGGTGKGKTNVLKLILNQLTKAASVYLFDSRVKGLYTYQQSGYITYIQSESDWKGFLDDMGEKCEERERMFETAIMNDSGITAREYYKEMEPCYVIIEDADQFVEYCNDNFELEEEMPVLLERMAGVGISIFLAAHVEKLRGYDDLTSWIKGVSYGFLLSDQGPLDIFSIGSYGELPEFGEGLLFENGSYRRVRIPKC